MVDKEKYCFLLPHFSTQNKKNSSKMLMLWEDQQYDILCANKITLFFTKMRSLFSPFLVISRRFSSQSLFSSFRASFFLFQFFVVIAITAYWQHCCIFHRAYFVDILVNKDTQTIQLCSTKQTLNTLYPSIILGNIQKIHHGNVSRNKELRVSYQKLQIFPRIFPLFTV